MTKASQTTGAQAVSRALALLRLAATGQDAGLSLGTLSELAGLSRPTAHRLLKAMAEADLIEQLPGSRHYRVGNEVLYLGLARPSGLRIRSLAEPLLRDLARELGDTVFLSVRHGTESVCIWRELGTHAIQVLSIDVGARRPLGASVSGVMLLAAHDAEVASALLVANRTRLAKMNFNVAAIERDVALAREHQHTFAPQGLVPGTSALAVPVVDKTGQPIAAISVAAITSRMTPQRLPAILAAMEASSVALARRSDEDRQRYKSDPRRAIPSAE
jgi:DNA-binding IclR family transcriptional regulator